LYPELKNVKISTFVNTNIFPFPPELSNSVFYRDILIIENVEQNKYLQTNNNDVIYLDSSNKNLIQIIQSKSSAVQINKYYPVCYGDHVQFCIPGTSFFIKETENGKLKWEPSLEILYENDMEFKIVPIDKNSDKKIGDIITYGDVFAIEYSDTSIVCVNKDYNYLELIYDNLSDVSKYKNIKFKFVSKMNGYYCDNGVCKDVPINDIEKSGKTGLYKGIPVSRHPGCWGLCTPKNGVFGVFSQYIYTNKKQYFIHSQGVKFPHIYD
jgi:hypothetical protein